MAGTLELYLLEHQNYIPTKNLQPLLWTCGEKQICVWGLWDVTQRHRWLCQVHNQHFLKCLQQTVLEFHVQTYCRLRW